MSTTLIEIRRARPSDARAVAAAHDEAWRTAYQGIIPGLELERLINRRGAAWWDGSIRKGSRVSLFVFGDAVAGYANYGRNIRVSDLGAGCSAPLAAISCKAASRAWWSGRSPTTNPPSKSETLIL